MYYDNIINYIGDNLVQEYISSKKYFNTELSPNIDGYIVIGGDKISWRYILQNTESNKLQVLI